MLLGGKEGGGEAEGEFGAQEVEVHVGVWTGGC